MRIPRRLVYYLLAAILLAAAALPAQAALFLPTTQTTDSPISIPGGAASIVRVYYTSQVELEWLAAYLDVLESHPEKSYLLARIDARQYNELQSAGYRLELDTAASALLDQPLQSLPGQVSGIPGYPCYRTVEETIAAMQGLAASKPALVSMIDIGDSWEKTTAGGAVGYDLYALVLTNKAIPGPKPRFFVMAEIHARELVTTETALRFVEYLLNQYGQNADVTWLLDYFELHVVPLVNPDGRKWAETGEWWRKNTDNNDGCSSFPDYGVDLNRNHSFKWASGGSSGYACDETYHGPSAASEPETQAIQAYVRTLYPDQRGAGDTDPAPLDTTGLLLSLHSYSELVIWPWGWTSTAAPNVAGLRTLGRKMAYFNGYTPQQSYQLYATSGSTTDWAYGELGIPAYTIEQGTSFFQSCSTFESTIYPDNLQTLLYAARTVRTPYMTPSGPDALALSATPGSIAPGDPVQLSATINDTRYENSNGSEPTQNIAAAVYTIDALPWSAPISDTMAAADGSFNSPVEGVSAAVNTSGLAVGRHTLYIRGQDAAGNWGAVSAVFLNVLDPAVSPRLQGSVARRAPTSPWRRWSARGLSPPAPIPAPGSTICWCSAAPTPSPPALSVMHPPA